MATATSPAPATARARIVPYERKYSSTDFVNGFSSGFYQGASAPREAGSQLCAAAGRDEPGQMGQGVRGRPRRQARGLVQGGPDRLGHDRPTPVEGAVSADDVKGRLEPLPGGRPAGQEGPQLFASSGAGEGVDDRQRVDPLPQVGPRFLAEDGPVGGEIHDVVGDLERQPEGPAEPLEPVQHTGVG